MTFVSRPGLGALAKEFARPALRVWAIVPTTVYKVPDGEPGQNSAEEPMDINIQGLGFGEPKRCSSAQQVA